MLHKILLAEHSGFCFGVRRAIRIARHAASESKQPIYSLGPLIHNRQEVERLKEKGIHVAKTLRGIKTGTVIIRSHGIHPELLKKAKSKGLSIVDATCPFVQKVHQIVSFLKKEGYGIIIIGEKNHPEVMALPGVIRSTKPLRYITSSVVKVVEKPSDVKKIHGKRKLGIVSQTTQTIENFNEIVSAILPKASELRIFNTICMETFKRQESAKKLADRVDSMLVVGGYNSANTRRLAEICRKTGTETHHIETAGEIKAVWCRGKKVIGITAGASTPNWIIKSVVKKIRVLSFVFFILIKILK